MKLSVLIPLVVVVGSVRGQGDLPTIDMTMSDNGRGQVEFRIRSDGYFDGIMSSLTFTVRWPASAGMALDTAVRCYPFQDVVPVAAVVPVTNGGWMYRTFNGFSITTLTDMGLAWQAGQEYPICTADILVPGTTVELSQDVWTLANNRRFYVSLNGVDNFGHIFESPEPDVAIRAMNQGTANLDVALTPQEDFFGWVTDLDFTLRWPESSGTSLGPVLQSGEVAEYLPIQKVGAEVDHGGFTYQKFHGEGIKSIANSDDAWHAGQDVIALSMPMFGDSLGIMVVNDDWTTTNGGDYLIELNGDDHAGPIEGVALSVAPTGPEEIGATVLPVANGFNLAIDLPNSARTATFSLHNAAGQLLWSTSREGAHGRTNMLAETGAIPDGLYILSVRQGEQSLTKRVVR